jgi:hypothetical protein
VGDDYIGHILQILRRQSGGGLDQNVLLEMIRQAMAAQGDNWGLERAQAMQTRNAAREHPMPQHQGRPTDRLYGQEHAAAMHARNDARKAEHQAQRQDASLGQPIRRNPVLDAMKSRNAVGGDVTPRPATQGIGGPAPQGTTPRPFESFLPAGMKRPSPFNTPSQPTVVSGPAGTPPPKNHYTFGGFGNGGMVPAARKPR